MGEELTGLKGLQSREEVFLLSPLQFCQLLGTTRLSEGPGHIPNICSGGYFVLCSTSSTGNTSFPLHLLLLFSLSHIPPLRTVSSLMSPPKALAQPLPCPSPVLPAQTLTPSPVPGSRQLFSIDLSHSR